MSLRRLAATAAVLAAVAAGLAALAGSPVEGLAALRAPQRLVDATGPEALVLAITGAVAWVVWAWGALGLLLAAAGTLPGLAGAAARTAQRLLVPTAGRRATALLLGVGVGLAGPGAVLTAAAAGPVPDWPLPATPTATTAPPAPDWPSTAATDSHRVVPGDCLWHIGEQWLTARSGQRPANAQIASAVAAWWDTNSGVIGPDPDLLRPGQVLRPPPSP